MLLNDELSSQKDIFALAGVSPKTAVFMHVNDLFGTQMSQGIHKMMPDYNLPYTIVEEISYDPAARDLSVEVTKAKATNAEIMVVVGRLNDAMLLTREMIKQRWTPQAILSMGPGWYENQYTKTLGKMSDGPLSLVPWYDPNKKLSQMLEAALAKAYPDFNLNTNHVFTFEALLVAADAYKRAGSADPKALAEALHATNITDNVDHRARHQVRRQGSEYRGEVRRCPEPRWQAGDGRAERGRQRQAGMANETLSGSRVSRA